MDAADHQTLKLKLKLHWASRDFRPKVETANKIGAPFVWLYTLSLVYTSVYIYIPYIWRDSKEAQFWFQLLVWVITIEVVVNWILCARKMLSRVPPVEHQQQDHADGKWPTCPKCQVDYPPRSHHCNLCGICVLKRDHHCYFTASCVGFYNQRYFIVLTFYTTIASIYGVVLVFRYLQPDNPILSMSGFGYIPIVALGQWIMGYISMGHFLVVLQGFVCLVMSLGAFLLVFMQLLLVYRGQTHFEAEKSITRYSGNPWKHFRSVFGPYWLLNFIFPLPTLQDGDGMSWDGRAKFG